MLVRRFFIKENIPAFIFIVLSILFSYFVFSDVQSSPTDDLRLLLSFVALTFIFVTFKAQIEPIEYSIALIVLTAVALSLGNTKIATLFATYSYMLVIVSIVIYFYKFRKMPQS